MVAARSVRDHRLQLLDHAGLNEDAGLIGRDRRIEHLGEYLAFQVRQTTRAVCLFGLYAAAGETLRCGSHSTSATKPSSDSF